MNHVELCFKDAVATMTLSRPGGNRIDFQMREEIRDAIIRVAESDARVLVVRGAGNDFCLGGDVRDWVGVSSAELRPRIGIYADALDRFDSLAIPTLAVIQGGCRGGGFELALSCDFILAARTAEFSFPEAQVGILTLQGGMYLLAERIGLPKAMELVMLSTPVSASQLLNWNAVNTVVADDELEAAASEMAGRLAAGPTAVYACTKQLLRLWRDKGRPAAREALYDMSMPFFDTPQVQASLKRVANASA